MFGLGLPELAVILAIVLLVFGGRRIPMLGKALGEGVSNFKKAIKNENVRDVENLSESETKA